MTVKKSSKESVLGENLHKALFGVQCISNIRNHGSEVRRVKVRVWVIWVFYGAEEFVSRIVSVLVATVYNEVLGL